MEKRQLNFDVSRGGIQHRLFVRAGDAKSRTIIATMHSGGEKLEFSSARIRVLGSDGTEHFSDCEVSESTITYTLTTQDIGEGGEVLCEFVLTSGDSIMTSPRFAVICEKCLYTGEGVESSDEYQAYISALKKIDNISITAEKGEDAAVSASENETGGIALRFILPKGEKGDKGDPGEKGADGVDGKDGKQGEKGEKGDAFTYSDFTEEQLAALKGEKGEDGVSIESVKQTTTSTANSGTNVITVTLSNGETATFQVRNGAQGDPGSPAEVDIWEQIRNNFRRVYMVPKGRTPSVIREEGDILRKVTFLDVAGLRTGVDGISGTDTSKQTVLLTDYTNSKSSGDYTAILGHGNQNFGNGNIIGGIRNYFTGRAGSVVGESNSVYRCATGAIVGGTSQIVDDATVQMALNNFRLHTDGTIKTNGVIYTNGKKVATEESMKAYIDEAILGGAW